MFGAAHISVGIDALAFAFTIAKEAAPVLIAMLDTVMALVGHTATINVFPVVVLAKTPAIVEPLTV